MMSMKHQNVPNRPRQRVSGITATSPRPTALAAALVATAVALPVGSILLLIDLLL